LVPGAKERRGQELISRKKDESRRGKSRELERKVEKQGALRKITFFHLKRSACPVNPGGGGLEEGFKKIRKFESKKQP